MADIRIDRTGQKFGKLTILSYCKKEKGQQQMVMAKCDCGTVKQYRLSSLVSGNTTSCGCIRRLYLIGKRFGKLVVQEYAGQENQFSMWKCQCDCGNTSVVRGNSLTSGNTRSCGCEFRKWNPSSITDQVDGTRIKGLLYTKRSNNTSGHTGVSFNKRRGKWEAYIRFKGYQYHLGLYESLDDAILARKNAETQIHGNFLDWFAKEHPELWEKFCHKQSEKKK